MVFYGPSHEVTNSVAEGVTVPPRVEVVCVWYLAVAPELALVKLAHELEVALVLVELVERRLHLNIIIIHAFGL